MTWASILPLALLLGTGEPPPPCVDWKALELEAIKMQFLSVPVEDVADLFAQAAEAAECLQEPPEVIDNLWLRHADWVSMDEPAEGVAFAEKRLEKIRRKHGDRHPSEVRYLWFQGYYLWAAQRELPRAERKLRRALRIQREAYGKDSLQVAAALRRLAFFYSGTGKREKGLKIIDQVIQTAEKAGRAGRVELCQALAIKDKSLSQPPVKDADQIPKLRDRWNALWEEIKAEGLPMDNTIW